MAYFLGYFPATICAMKYHVSVKSCSPNLATETSIVKEPPYLPCQGYSK